MLEQAEEDGGSLLQDNVERTSATDDGGLLLQDAVGRIADEGGCLEWVPASGPASDAHYVVLDGDLFEARFNAIRRRKRPRTGTSVARSFSGMSKHFVLLSGEGPSVPGTDGFAVPTKESIGRGLCADHLGFWRERSGGANI